jgi:hypothetical protein
MLLKRELGPGIVHVPLIPALQRLKQEDGEFQATLGCIVRPCLKMTTTKPRKLFSIENRFLYVHTCIYF